MSKQDREFTFTFVASLRLLLGKLKVLMKVEFADEALTEALGLGPAGEAAHWSVHVCC